MALFSFSKRKAPVSMAVVDSDESCYQEAMKALRHYDFKFAHKIICQWNVHIGKPSLGFDWRVELEQGLNEETESILQNFYMIEADTEMLHNAVFCVLSGTTPHKVSKWACPDKEKRNEVYLDIHYFWSYYMTLNDIQGLLDEGCEKVVFLATLDKKTCPNCGIMDMKKIKIKGSIIGKNLPPLHRGCRCTTVPYYDDEDLSDQTRVARDVDGNPIEVPASMTWKQWKKINS